MTYAEQLQADLINIFESDNFGIFEEEKVYKVEKHSEYQSKVMTSVFLKKKRYIRLKNIRNTKAK